MPDTCSVDWLKASVFPVFKKTKLRVLGIGLNHVGKGDRTKRIGCGKQVVEDRDCSI